MRKIFFLLFIASNSFSQSFLSPDSSDVFFKDLTINQVVFKANDTELKAFEQKFGKMFDNKAQYTALLNVNVDEWEMDLFDKRNEALNYLKQKEKDFEPAVFKRLEAEVMLNYWHLLYVYPVLRSNADQKLKTVVSLPKVMTKSFDLPKGDELLAVKSYRDLLNFWVIYQNSEKNKFVKYADMVQSAVDKSDYAVQNLQKQSLDYVLANILQENSNRISSSAARYILSQINSEKIQQNFKGDFIAKIVEKEHNLEAKAKEEATKKAKSSGLDIAFLDREGKTFDLSKYKGKVVYLDIWASWCGPCRAEFPYSKKMHESLNEKEKKNIVFLYISIDDKEENWKNAIQNLNLDGFEHGFSSGGWGSQIVQKFKITGIPRYMIINKEGAVVKPDAKRPSNPETLSELLELAK